MIQTELFQQSMNELQLKVDAVRTILARENLSLEGASGEKDLEGLAQKASDRIFRLLIMGRFSSGKSSCVNVLLGERILAEGAVPMTALITEICYGEDKKVVMYPRKGKWAGGDEPFEIEATAAEIRKFSTLNAKNGINTKEANRIDAAFEKMVIYWPLEMLRDGVTIVDSPGADDPYANDHIVESYVSKADAVIYCIPANRAYNAIDKNALERINSIGFDQPIIITTCWDIVAGDLSEEEQRRFKEQLSVNYSRHTSPEKCHYVNSRLGRKAKETGSKEAYAESGYEELEKFLGEYLTQNRGREKIAALTAGITAYDNLQISRIQGILASLDLPMETFDERMEKAEECLEKAQLQGQALLREFQKKSENAGAEIAKKIPELYDSIYSSINLDEFEPDTSFRLWNPKKSSEQIAEECSAEVKRRTEKAAAEWNESVLQPRISKLMEEISSDLQDQTDQFSESVRQAHVEIEEEFGTVQTGVKTGTRVAMLVYGLLTNSWIEALLGGVYGGGAFIRSAVCQFGAYFILGIVSYFTPVGLPALVVASLAGMITGVGWTAARACGSIKKKTVEQALKSLEENRDSILEKVQTQCDEIFVMAQDKLKAAIDEDLNEVRSSIRIIREERATNAQQAQERKCVLEHVSDYLMDTNRQMDEIRERFSIERIYL